MRRFWKYLTCCLWYDWELFDVRDEDNGLNAWQIQCFRCKKCGTVYEE